MSTRRERGKSQSAQQSRLSGMQEVRVVFKDTKSRKEKFSNYLIDISKYVMTGVVIASLFKDLTDNKVLIYLLGLFIAFTSLGVGMVLTSKKKE
jgi:hypothetical protein